MLFFVLFSVPFQNKTQNTTQAQQHRQQQHADAASSLTHSLADTTQKGGRYEPRHLQTLREERKPAYTQAQYDERMRVLSKEEETSSPVRFVRFVRFECANVVLCVLFFALFCVLLCFACCFLHCFVLLCGQMLCFECCFLHYFVFLLCFVLCGQTSCFSCCFCTICVCFVLCRQTSCFSCCFLRYLCVCCCVLCYVRFVRCFSCCFSRCVSCCFLHCLCVFCFVLCCLCKRRVLRVVFCTICVFVVVCFVAVFVVLFVFVFPVCCLLQYGVCVLCQCQCLIYASVLSFVCVCVWDGPGNRLAVGGLPLCQPHVAAETSANTSEEEEDNTTKQQVQSKWKSLTKAKGKAVMGIEMENCLHGNEKMRFGIPQFTNFHDPSFPIQKQKTIVWRNGPGCSFCTGPSMLTHFAKSTSSQVVLSIVIPLSETLVLLERIHTHIHTGHK